MGLAITKYGVKFFRNGVEITVIALEIKMLSYLRIYKHLYINDLKYFLKISPKFFKFFGVMFTYFWRISFLTFK